MTGTGPQPSHYLPTNAHFPSALNCYRKTGRLVGKGGETTRHRYWNTTTSGKIVSAGGTGKTTSKLQTPAASGIYANWNVNVDRVAGNGDPCNFGTNSPYRILKYDALQSLTER